MIRVLQSLIVRHYLHYLTQPQNFCPNFFIMVSEIHEIPENDDSALSGEEDSELIDLASDTFLMGQAMRQAQKAYLAGEVPVGAIIVQNGSIIARSHNQVETLKDATAHAEMLALTQAQEALGDWRLTDCDLYVTKEPCPMCAGAIVHCRIRRVIFGCGDANGGAAGGFINLLQQPTLNHFSEVTPGVLQEESKYLLKSFFLEARTKKMTGQSGESDSP
jgi:tRNA(adenine34) deaminase